MTVASEGLGGRQVAKHERREDTANYYRFRVAHMWHQVHVITGSVAVAEKKKRKRAQWATRTFHDWAAERRAQPIGRSLPEVSFGSGESRKRWGRCRRDGKIDWYKWRDSAFRPQIILAQVAVFEFVVSLRVVVGFLIAHVSSPGTYR
jgi:hypothetical protein